MERPCVVPSAGPSRRYYAYDVLAVWGRARARIYDAPASRGTSRCERAVQRLVLRTSERLSRTGERCGCCCIIRLRLALSPPRREGNARDCLSVRHVTDRGPRMLSVLARARVATTSACIRRSARTCPRGRGCCRRVGERPVRSRRRHTAFARVYGTASHPMNDERGYIRSSRVNVSRGLSSGVTTR